MKVPEKLNNAVLTFGMERRMKRISTLILLLVGIFVVGIGLISGIAESMVLGVFGGGSDATIGYVVLSVALFFVVALFSALSAAGEISGEKSRQTLDLLICSQLTPRQIISGKLLSNFLYSMLITVIMFPLYAVLYLFGGFTPLGAAEFIAYMLVHVFCTLSIAIFFSAKVKKTAAATILTIVTYVGWAAVNGVLALIWLAVEDFLSYTYGFNSFFTYPPILWLNQVTGFVMLFAGQLAGWSSLFTGTLETFEALIPLILGIVIPVVVSILCIRGATKAVDPMRSKKTSGGI